MTAGSGDEPSEGVVFERADDGTITARDLETGLSRDGETRMDAMARLAEALERHEGGEAIDEEGEPGSGLGLHPDGLDSWCR